MKSVTTSGFRKCFAELPQRIQQRARESYKTFLRDPSHPGLQLKQVHTTRPIFSARVSIEYRALALREDETWVWFWIGSHSDYDRAGVQGFYAAEPMQPRARGPDTRGSPKNIRPKATFLTYRSGDSQGE